jgi:hypothetical protein
MLGLTKEMPLKINRTKAARTTSRDKRNGQSTCWQTRKGWGQSKKTMD